MVKMKQVLNTQGNNNLHHVVISGKGSIPHKLLRINKSNKYKQMKQA